jgi:hypothetical protein
MKHPLRRRLFFIVDALDESHDRDRRAVVEFLWSLLDTASDKCVVKVFLATRPINEVSQNLTLRCRKILLQDQNKNDIITYVRRILGSTQVNCDQRLRERVVEYIVENADGVFVWVRLIAEELLDLISQGESPQQVYKTLESLPTDLEGLYEHMLNSLKRDTNAIQESVRILQFCLFSHGSITLAEMCDALAIASEGSISWVENRPQNMKNKLIHRTSSFLEIKHNTTTQPIGNYSYSMNVLYLALKSH